MKRLLQSLYETRLWRVFFGPKKFEALVFFDNQVTRWQWSEKQLPRPPAADLLEVRWFRSEIYATGWLRGRTVTMRNVRVMVIKHESV